MTLLTLGPRGAEAADASPDSANVAAQRDIADVLRGWFRRPVRTDLEKELKPGLSLTLLPSVGYNPSYGAFVGASISLGGWFGDPATTNLSAGSFGASYSTTEQISVQFKSDFYLPNNITRSKVTGATWIPASPLSASGRPIRRRPRTRWTSRSTGSTRPCTSE
jgi:hypothetical protein